MRSYYDELGVSPHASAEEIRETYRNLVRLLHPDQQADGALKDAGEHQMKRINYIHAVLSDPEKRRRYDAESAQALERSAPIIFHAPPPPPPPRSYRGTFAWVVAALICGALISWFINRETSGLPEYAETVSASPAREAAGEKSAPAGTAPAPNGDWNAEAAQRQIVSLRSQLRAADEQRSLLAQEIAKLRGEPKPRRKPIAAIAVEPAETPALTALSGPPPAPSPALDSPVFVPSKPDHEIPLSSAPKHDETSRNRFTGVWFYARPKLQTFRKAFYPPEYIEANIVEENGAIRGRYRARYQVTDRAISPDVNFDFEGKASGSSASLPWTGGGGSRGEVQLKLISDSSLEVVWSASQLGRTLGLAAGSAVLVRRAEP